MPFIPPPSMSAPPPASSMAGLSGMSLNQPSDVNQNAQTPQDGSVMKLFYSIERAIESLAAAVPKESGKLDAIKSSLREVLNSVLSEGPQQDTSPNLLKGGAESY